MDATSVAMIDAVTARVDDKRLFKSNEETNATTPAKIIAGPKLFAGASVYIITARKMKASATDLYVWLPPSTFATGTVKRLVNAVSASRSRNDPSPLHPRNGSLQIE